MSATFDDRLRGFYRECNEEEQGVIAFMVASARVMSDALGDEVEGFRSDLGQQLQLALNEANSLYARSIAANSDVAAKHSQTMDSILRNLKG